MSDFENRLRKNAKHRLKWAARQGLTAFRVYDLDMPEYPFAVDWYAGFAHIMEYPRRKHLREGTIEALRAQVVRATGAVLAVAEDHIFTKTHEPMPWGERQYGRAGGGSTTVVVTEHDLKFEANLSDYLDTGLFLDHRTTRALVRERAKGTRMLNLFAYTGSFTVNAIAGGAVETTTVDLSNTYCEWAGRNLALNGQRESAQHQLVRADVLAFIGSARGPYDLIVLDPPSFSTSKKMETSFNVQRDHRRLIDLVRRLLGERGTLYFSTNYLDFQLERSLISEGTELTPRSIPEDFRRTVHRCWTFGPNR